MSGTGRRTFVNPLVAGFVAGVLLALVLALLAKINLDLAAPWSHTHTVSAQVADVDGISVSSDVRIAGRIVGQITDVQARGTYATVTFHVDDGDWPLPADTTASIRLATLLGQKYLELVPGHSSQAMLDNAVIGLQSTRPVVDFDQVLNSFDKPTRDSLTSLIRTVAGSVQGQEGTLQQLIPNLSNLSTHSNTPTQELVARNGELNAILINLGIAAGQLNASRDDLAGVIDNANTITGALAANQARALTGFITNTDTLNITSHSVLGGGTAAALDTGLQKLSTFATTLNTLLVTLLPETASFTQPVPGAEPSDIVNGNGGIPAKSSIDLIYEIGQASSQGYGSHNFGTSAAPNFQGSFFLRQNLQGFETCYANTPPCTWGQTGATSASSLPALPPLLPLPAAPTPTPAPFGTPIPVPSAIPSPIGLTGPSATPLPTATATPSPTGTPAPTPTPAPSPTSTPILVQGSRGSPAPASAADVAGSVWDVLFTVSS